MSAGDGPANAINGFKGFQTMNLAARFWSKVEKTGECWLWKGASGQRGYGQFWMNGKLVPAHRAAWEIVNGTASPKELDACHKCDNPPCVRPDHIFFGTARENLLDALRKNRLPKKHKKSRFCRNGHLRTVENTRVYMNGTSRRCRICDKIREALSAFREFEGNGKEGVA